MLIICGLAVYKVLQLIEALLPKEPMPWVKVLAASLLGIGVTFVTDIDNDVVHGLAIATIAGAAHSLLRLTTLAGDLMRRRAVTR
jgi:hypothetical protein